MCLLMYRGLKGGAAAWPPLGSATDFINKWFIVLFAFLLSTYKHVSLQKKRTDGKRDGQAKSVMRPLGWPHNTQTVNHTAPIGYTRLSPRCPQRKQQLRIERWTWTDWAHNVYQRTIVQTNTYTVPHGVDDSEVTLECRYENSVCRHNQQWPEWNSRQPHATNKLIADAAWWHDASAIHVDNSRQ